MKRSCESCGGPYEAVRATARFCSERCRKRAQRGHLIDLPAAAGTGAPDGGLSTRVAAELGEAGRLNTSLGQGALVLARRIEEGRDTGTAVAALMRELRAVLTDALKGAQTRSALDGYRDELAARRRGAR